tara:strand:- start:1358 stop:1888 length:531 start_codon:yes stop_codon:yes gene_type:complete
MGLNSQTGRRSRARHGQSISIDGIDAAVKKIDKLVRWQFKAKDKFVALNTRVAQVYPNYLKANIKNYNKNIWFRGSLIKPGQLKKSAGTWRPSKLYTNVMGGPRTNNILPRKTRWQADGFYAHIVEKGDFGPRFGGKHRTQNTGVFSKGMKATQNRSKKLHVVLLQKEFARYIKAA